MRNEPVYRARVRRFIRDVEALRYGSQRSALSCSVSRMERGPFSQADAESAGYSPIVVGETWGNPWTYAWFKLSGVVPAEFSGKNVVALLNVQSEGCVYRGGKPLQGITAPDPDSSFNWLKRRVPLFESAKSGTEVSLMLEASANRYHPNKRNDTYTLVQAELAILQQEYWQLFLDLEVLWETMQALPRDSVRARRILWGLNRCANIWAGGNGAEECREYAQELLKKSTSPSALTAWSIGNAHIDLAWLWPARETRLKGIRTFTTALRLMQEYPDYVFGASQPQLYEWIKTDQPELYRDIKAAAKRGQWECLGAMWVEPDTNIPSGESLVRQCMYGKRFFQDEFDVDITNLWLPDVFGYSAALPQILRKCGVDTFFTQKISWNETNPFPFNTFWWEGIDGSRVLSHFAPTNSYVGENEPDALYAAEKRFAEAEVCDEFLNPYGNGDGGGGPSRLHIERARRLSDCEGMPRVKMGTVREFFERMTRKSASLLPLWTGELYLEFHRGTLTTQAVMKKLNRRLELLLRDLEFFAVLSGQDIRQQLNSIWKDTLLNQFHDILPGSSVNRVYREAESLSQQNISKLEDLRANCLVALHGKKPEGSQCFVVYNTLSWARCEVIEIPISSVPDKRYEVVDSSGRVLPSHQERDVVLVRVDIPPMGWTTVELEPGSGNLESLSSVRAGPDWIENDLTRVEFDPDGTFGSIRDKSTGTELIAGTANRIMLWEDIPYNFDAWDISPYYRETQPEQARLLERDIILNSPVCCKVRQKLQVGDSEIVQIVSLASGDPLVKVETEVDWREENKLLKVHADTAIRSPEATFEIQYGTLSRPTHHNTTWDSARFEVVGHRFADLSDPKCGLTLVNDCKYGYSVYGSALELSLLRSPKEPDPEADIRKHEFTYGYIAHPGSLWDSGAARRASELNSPLVIRAVPSRPDNPLRSVFRIDGEGVRIEVVKHREQGNGIVLRLYEERGARAGVKLRSSVPWKSAIETDLLENAMGRIEGTATEMHLNFTPFELKTFVLEGLSAI